MIRPIQINPVLNGFVVQVGCQTVVFNSVKELTDEINNYYSNPGITEQRFINRAVNRTMDNPLNPAPPVPPRSNLRSMTDPVPTCAPEQCCEQSAQTTGIARA